MRNNICARCALRLQKAAQTDSLPAGRRAFSQTTSRRKHHGIPQFIETSSPELNDVLASMRSKHFVPAYLNDQERRLIFGTKNKQVLTDNPQVVLIGDEEVELKWTDRRTEIPNRTKLFREAVRLMAESEDGKGWQNLPALLTGLKKAKAGLAANEMAKIVRKTADSGRLGTVIQCLQQADNTGMTLKDREVLDNMVWGLHDMAQKSGWSAGEVHRALKDANQLAIMLETEEHGAKRTPGQGDARRRPEVIGVFLELAAVDAYKFQGGQDKEGKVKMYAERLLGCIGNAPTRLTGTPAENGPQYEMLHGVPIWHGLRLAEKILGGDIPHPQLAKEVQQQYETALQSLAQALDADVPQEGTYGDQALRAWSDCIRD